jgi:hypothetical protein
VGNGAAVVNGEIGYSGVEWINPLKTKRICFI